MSTPSTYFATQLQLDGIKGMAFELLMSLEIVDIRGPLAARLADHVFDMTEAEANAAVKAYLEILEPTT